MYWSRLTSSFFPMDFVVLDMEEDKEIPLILGRPFLAKGRALIDVHSGRVNYKEVRFNIYHTMKFPFRGQSCNRISMVDECIKGVVDGVLMDNPLEHCLIHSSFRKTSLAASDIEFSGFDMEDEQLECTFALDSLPVSNHEEMLEVTTPVCEVSKSTEELAKEKNGGLVLKQLSDHLRYAFLGSQSKFPVVTPHLLNSFIK